MIRIRRAAPEDLPQVLRYRRAMLSEMGSSDPAALDRMELAAAAFLRDEACHIWMAEDGKPVGCGLLHVVPWIPSSIDPSDRRAWVHNVYTEPEYRRQGIASRLMQEMIAWARAHGFHSLSLHASEHGRSLYESLGFRPSNEMRLFW